MDYELRRLKSDDMFVLTTIITKIGYKEFKKCFDAPEVKAVITKGKTDPGTDVDAVGMAIAFDALGIILENLPKVKDDLYSFLGSLSGMKNTEIADLDLPVFMQMIIDVIQKEEFSDFFQVVLRFLH